MVAAVRHRSRKQSSPTKIELGAIVKKIQLDDEELKQQYLYPYDLLYLNN